MWKYYAKNGSYYGYNIGLFVPALVDEWIDRDTGLIIEDGEVIYSNTEKQIKILEAVTRIYEHWCKYEKSDQLNLKISTLFKEWISYIGIFFKGESFSTEEEYRFVAIAPKDKLNKLYYRDGQTTVKIYDFRVVNGVLVPYLKVPICTYNDEECWVINSIGISPTQHYEQMANGIMQLTKSLDYNLADFKVKKSEIPLRY